MTEADSITKVCTKCKSEKTVSSFNNDRSRKDGKFPHCRECSKMHLKEMYQKHKEKRSLAGKDNYSARKDEYKERAKKWSKENPEKRKQIAKKYVENNLDQRYETQKNNRLKNPGLYAAHFKARQQRKRQAMPLWASEESIKAIYRQSAWATKVSGIKHHVDHFYPLKSDVVCGLHNEFNLRIIPAKDNLLKGNNFPG